MNNFIFRMMTHAGLPIRDLFMPPAKMLAEASPKPGERVLDYGCGPGSLTLPAARAVGDGGSVTAVDIVPLALRYVERRAARAGLTNIETRLPAELSGMPGGEFDLVILFDVYHMVEDGPALLAELRRLIRPGGRLAFSDHHLDAVDLGPVETIHGRWEPVDIGPRTVTLRAA